MLYLNEVSSMYYIQYLSFHKDIHTYNEFYEVTRNLKYRQDSQRIPEGFPKVSKSGGFDFRETVRIWVSP